jgi:hypothetical protein
VYLVGSALPVKRTPASGRPQAVLAQEADFGENSLELGGDEFERARAIF